MARAHIMVVEDDRVVALAIQNKLEKFGYSVPVVVPSGEEAIKAAEETILDLVLMDIMLEGEMDGVDTAEEIRTSFHIPVVYLTAHSDEATLQRAKITEPLGYVLKPFGDRELHTAIEIALYKHKLEKQLKESEQWLSTTLNSIGDAVIATDGNGSILFMNPVAEARTAWTQQEALGKNVSKVLNLINEQSRKRIEDPVKKAQSEGVVIDLTNHPILIANNGAEMPIDMNIAPIKYNSGDSTGVVLVFRDITERKRAEEERIQKEKLETVLEIVGAVCHEMASPLYAAIGNVDISLKNISKNSVKKRLQKVNNLLIKMREILERLRNITNYKTKDYLSDVKIVDINSASKKG